LQQLTQKEAAKNNHISVSLVNRIVSKAKKNEDYLSSIKWAENNKQQKAKAVIIET
jgi:UDP-3-O-[3-hydroxymyristoyl] glucosamine N-acyltransferase